MKASPNPSVGGEKEKRDLPNPYKGGTCLK